MRFRDPWIGPRVVDLRPAQAQSYLVRRGWRLVGPAANPLLLLFEAPPGTEPGTILLPTEQDQGPMLQRMIDLVAEVARHEDRWAVAVLDEILRQPVGPLSGNDPPVPANAGAAPR